MLVAILGGTGFVGTALVSRLAGGGARVRVLTRNLLHAKALQVLPDVELISANVFDPRALGRALRGCDAVINLVGILNERGFGGAGFDWVHHELTRRVVEAAIASDVPIMLQMSSLGADAKSAPSYYLRSKGAAEDAVRAASARLDFSIFRPSVIFGPHDSLFNRFAGLLRMTGGVLPLAKPDARLAPIFVDDVTLAFTRALEQRSRASRQSFDLCGPEIVSLEQLVRLTAQLIGIRARIVRLPDALAYAQALVMNLVPGKPFSTDNYRSLSVESVCRDNGCARLGIAPRPLRAILPGYL